MILYKTGNMEWLGWIMIMWIVWSYLQNENDVLSSRNQSFWYVFREEQNCSILYFNCKPVYIDLLS